MSILGKIILEWEEEQDLNLSNMDKAILEDNINAEISERMKPYTDLLKRVEARACNYCFRRNNKTAKCIGKSICEDFRAQLIEED